MEVFIDELWQVSGLNSDLSHLISFLFAKVRTLVSCYLHLWSGDGHGEVSIYCF